MIHQIGFLFSTELNCRRFQYIIVGSITSFQQSVFKLDWFRFFQFTSIRQRCYKSTRIGDRFYIMSSLSITDICLTSHFCSDYDSLLVQIFGDDHGYIVYSEVKVNISKWKPNYSIHSTARNSLENSFFFSIYLHYWVIVI